MTGLVISVGRTEMSLLHVAKLLSPVLLSCILLTRTITKRAVACVGFMQRECTVPSARGISEISNRHFC